MKQLPLLKILLSRPIPLFTSLPYQIHLIPPNTRMAPPRANTPSRHRPSQAVKAEPESEADTEAESSAPRAKTPYRRLHNQVAETEPEAEFENETRGSGAKTPSRHRPSRPIEADAEAENQIENLAQETVSTNPTTPRQWALHFANLVRSLIIPSSCFLCMALPSTLLPILTPTHSHICSRTPQPPKTC